MKKVRWLAIYQDAHLDVRAAIITPKEATDFPFGIDPQQLGLADYDGEGVVLIELPDDPDFRPMVVNNTADTEAPIQFINL